MKGVRFGSRVGSLARGSIDAALLAAALLLVVAVTYVPHLDTQNAARAGSLPQGLPGLGQAYLDRLLGRHADYPYPLHVDENLHWSDMAQLQRDETLRFKEPYTGVAPSGLFGLKGSVHEKGFHLAVAQFETLTGIPWPVLFRFAPALWMAVTAWGVWAFLRPWPGAPLAAALVALVPTSDRFIGPAFLVPIGLGLAWIPVAGLLAREAFDERRSNLLLVLVAAWAFYVHFIAGIAAIALVAATIPWSRHPRRAGVLLAAALLPVLWLVQTFLDELAAEATKYQDIPVQRAVFDQLGLAFLLLGALGILLLVFFPPREHRLALWSFAALSAVSFAMVSLNLAYNLRNYFLYERWHQPFALFATVPVAYAIVALARGLTARFGTSRLRPVLAGLVLTLLAAGALQEGVQGHLREPYYHVVDERDWASFTWAAHHLPAGYSTFLTDPWKAPVLNAMTGKRPVAVLYPGSPPLGGDVYEAYLEGGYGDGPFLVLHDATWVADPRPVTAPEYTMLGPDVYGLRSTYLDEYNAATGAR